MLLFRPEIQFVSPYLPEISVMTAEHPSRRDASRQEITFVATDSRGMVSAILNRPQGGLNEACATGGNT